MNEGKECKKRKRQRRTEDKEGGKNLVQIRTNKKEVLKGR